jgi:hypothetical protein
MALVLPPDIFATADQHKEFRSLSTLLEELDRIISHRPGRA